MADCAIYVLYNQIDGLALMEDRPDMRPGSLRYLVYPGGKVKDGEDHEVTMLRELREETGVEPFKWQALCQPFENPESGYIVSPFVVTEWKGTVPLESRDDNHALFEWVNPYVIEDSGPSARLTIARLLRDRFYPYPAQDRWSSWRNHERCEGFDCNHPYHLLAENAELRAALQNYVSRQIHTTSVLTYGMLPADAREYLNSDPVLLAARKALGGVI